MILLVDKIEKSFGARVLFSGASFQINPGERFALVGPNGAGKTTMLKIIMGIDSPDAGQVQYAKDCQVGYLEQETNLEQKNTTILAEVMAAAKEIRRMGERANELQAQITELSEQGKDVDALLNEYGQVQDRFEHLGGYELESNARKILSGLGFKVTDFERPCSEFSGGWQMRIALAKLFLRHPDLLLLDEPTNHLDLESVQWLRGFIANYDGAVLIVSHDRAFMDACVEKGRALGYAETLFGRRRELFELASSNRNVRSFGERAAMNTPVQGTAADIIKLAMVQVARRLKEGGYRAQLILQVHDELVVECPLAEADEVSALVQSTMESVVSLKVPLLAEVSRGSDWDQAH